MDEDFEEEIEELFEEDYEEDSENEDVVDETALLNPSSSTALPGNEKRKTISW